MRPVEYFNKVTLRIPGLSMDWEKWPSREGQINSMVLKLRDSHSLGKCL